MHIDNLCQEYNINKKYLLDHDFVYSDKRLIDNNYLDGTIYYNYFCSKCNLLFYCCGKYYDDFSAYIFINTDRRPAGSFNLVRILPEYKVLNTIFDNAMFDYTRIKDCSSIIIQSIIE